MKTRAAASATLKTIVRSATFWLMLAVLLAVTVGGVWEGYFNGDRADGIVITVQNYVQVVSNCGAGTLLIFCMPLFAIVTVTIIQSRDYGDRFFEIEKAAGQKPSRYVFVRFLTLIVLNAAVLILFHAICLHLYIGTRGGVEGMTIGEYLADAAVRQLRFDLAVGVPCIVFYIGIAFLFGSLFASKAAGAAGAIGYLVVYNVTDLFFRWEMGEFFFDYLAPIPNKLRFFVHYYDTPWFESTVGYFDVTPTDVVLCEAFLLLGAFACAGIAYLRTRGRSL